MAALTPTGPVTQDTPPSQHDGTMPPATSPGRTGRPPVTSRAAIVSAARSLIDRDGWEHLTIRKLAAELNIGPTTLYHYVKNKQDLLLLLLNEYAAQMALPDLPEAPRDRIVTVTQALHDMLAAWPWAAEVLTVDGFLGLLDEPALSIVELIVDAAVDHGCTLDQAVDVFRSLWYYTIGEVLVRAHSARGHADGEHLVQRATFHNLESPRLPRLSAVASRWRALAARDIYRTSLEAFVDGLLAQATATRTGQSTRSADR